eukprot:m.218992 g.218992  ORF g.218992 m.218992 type:complete len:749 (-) comp33285_c0_seq2:145-2391(-)
MDSPPQHEKSIEGERWEEFTERTLRQAAAVEQLTGSVRGLNHSLAESIDHGVEPSFGGMFAPFDSFVPINAEEPTTTYDDALRRKIQRDLEKNIRRREEEYDRSLLEHQQVVRRLQKDHNASEEAFRSIVTHLEKQLKAANAEAERNGARARQILSESQSEFDASCNAQSAMFQTALEREAANFELRFSKQAETCETEKQMLKSSVVELTSGLDETMVELGHLRTQVDRLSEDLLTSRERETIAREELQNATVNAKSVEIIQHDLRVCSEKVTTLTREKETLVNDHQQHSNHSSKLLKELQNNNRKLQENCAATSARLESELNQLRVLKEGEIKELKQLVLETKRDACEKVKKTIDDYQQKSQLMENKITTLLQQTDADSRERDNAVQKEREGMSSAHQEDLRAWKDQESKLLALIKDVETKSEIKLDKLKRKMEKEAAEHQLTIDQQHKLELERLRKMKDTSTLKQKEQTRLVKEDFAALSLIHAKELQAQRDEYEQVLINLRRELVQVTCQSEELQVQLKQQQSDHATTVMRLRLEKDAAENTCQAKLQQLNNKHEHDLTLFNVEKKSGLDSALLAEQERTRNLVQNIEHENRENLQRCESNVTELKKDLAKHRDMLDAAAITHEHEMEKVKEKHSVDILTISEENTQIIKSLQAEIKLFKLNLDEKQKFLEQADIKHRTEISLLSVEFRTKLKRMLPMEIKDDLENTIVSLKEQALALERKCSVLQEHIDASASNRPYYDRPPYY